MKRTLEQSHRENCHYKVKYADEFSAMQVYVGTWPRNLLSKKRQRIAKSLTLYICTCCGYIHLSQHGTRLVSEHEIKLDTVPCIRYSEVGGLQCRIQTVS